MRRLAAVVALAVPALLISATLMGAQTVRGRLVLPAGVAVPPGLLVELVDSANNVVARALSTSNGSFTLRGSGAGTYRVRALRIGFRPSISAALTLAAGEQHDLDLVLASTAVVLNAVNVAERRVCEVNPDTASQTAAAWGEVAKALTLSELTRAARRYHMLIALYTRQLDRAGRSISQTQSERDGTTIQPFVAASADSLARYGYVDMKGAHTTYYGPDAPVLLSNAFARTHCLRLVPRESRSAADSGWIGIAFEPIKDDRPDIAGVLWLDRHSKELREVEYRYVSLHPALEAGRPAGRVAFRPLPLGGWIVSDWWIRMPVVRFIQETGAAASSRTDVMSLHETGGQVLTVRSNNERIWVGRASGIRGEVIMESGATPAGVRLRLENTNRRALIDSTGRFAFDALFPGRYTVVAEAPHLSALGETPMRVTVDVADSVVTPLRVVVPSQADVVTRVCGKGTATDSLGLLRVIVSDSATQAPAADATVEGAWHRSLERQGNAVVASKHHRIGEQLLPGVFWLCAAPKDLLIELEIKRGRRLITAKTRIPYDSVFADHRVSIASP